ncbi:hypothetical protein P153DRAFT_226453 [Dothidotthia symphoricarpi CBS 119687]|uniref:Uncharacterized protein n=1 Tax=Dothidotthia symphoricarpi CBS 119687 TaxID=1392245 RepID=A0A6A6ADI5_9PLEO|nr:uncharacterized protein P153DRAFT_226453 [Dothidotthia symphoricarpi CBS 119687]KAF2129899.1 hypothetical protein P153DRAFT_226453 [Dothidotthia symphoricarpi CBS 119687]
MLFPCHIHQTLIANLAGRTFHNKQGKATDTLGRRHVHHNCIAPSPLNRRRKRGAKCTASPIKNTADRIPSGSPITTPKLGSFSDPPTLGYGVGTAVDVGVTLSKSHLNGFPGSYFTCFPRASHALKSSV